MICFFIINLLVILLSFSSKTEVFISFVIPNKPHVFQEVFKVQWVVYRSLSLRKKSISFIPFSCKIFVASLFHWDINLHVPKWVRVAHSSKFNFRQEFVEARRTAGLNNAPPCLWSPSPPQELNEAFTEALSANAGFVSFGMTDILTSYSIDILPFPWPTYFLTITVIFSRHVEGRKLDRTVWNLSTFHAYVNYHVKVRILNQKFLVYWLNYVTLMYFHAWCNAIHDVLCSEGL